MNNTKIKVNISSNDRLKVNLSDNDKLRIGLSNISYVSGSSDYEKLQNKPQINNVELVGNKSFEDLNLSSVTNTEIENILNS